jgi:hypothetical protein
MVDGITRPPPKQYHWFHVSLLVGLGYGLSPFAVQFNRLTDSSLKIHTEKTRYQDALGSSIPDHGICCIFIAYNELSL